MGSPRDNIIFWGMVLFLAACLTSRDCTALGIRGYTAARHDRFASGYPSSPVPNPTFFAADYDWSGVGWASGNSGQSVALISPQYFVCANHFRPSGSIIFRNRSGVLESRVIAAVYQTTTDWYGTIYTSDLCLGKLSEPVSKEVTYYPLLDPASSSWFVGRLAHVYGFTARVGTNAINYLGLASGSHCAVMEKGAVADEAHFEVGDSGSPSFVVYNGALTLVGIHSAVNPTSSTDSLVPAYLAQLNTHMAALGYSVATIDPSVATPTVQFTAAAQTVSEGAGTVTITAELTAATTLAVKIPFAVTGSATSGVGSDFTSSVSPLTIPAGATSASITVTVNDDGTTEADETVVVTMWTPSNAIRGAAFEQVLTIQDNDGATLPSVTFTTASQTGPEDAEALTVTAELSATSSTEVLVPFTVAGTATEGAAGDYMIGASPFTIPAGQLTASIVITLNDDSVDEFDETVLVTMGAPSGAVLGATTVHTVTLQDNDPTPPGDFDVDHDMARDFRDLVFCCRCQDPDMPTTIPTGTTLPAGESEESVDSRVEDLLVVRPDGFGGLDVDQDGATDARDFSFIDRRLTGHPSTVPDGTTLPDGITEADVNARIDALLTP